MGTEKLNQNKSKLLVISSRNSKFLSSSSNINHFGFVIESVVKNLGFMFDNCLDYNTQINKVCRNGFYALRNLWRISSKVTDVKLKIQIVNALILSQIDYCNSLYICLPKKQINKLQRLMNAAVRFIFNLKMRMLIV